MAGCSGDGAFHEPGTEPGADWHASSDTQIVIYGDEYILEYGANNRPGESTPRGHIIAPGGDDDLLAWAHYRTSGLVDERPVALFVDVTSVIAPGGDDDLPLRFWVGVSDYTRNRVQWHGPYTEDIHIVLNNDLDRDRYVSADYEMNFIIVTNCLGVEPTPENPDGITAVEIVSSTVTAKPAKDSKYLVTKPHYTNIADLYVVPPLYPGTIHVALTWEHIEDEGNEKLEAKLYTVYRLKVGEDKREKLALVIAPGEKFDDPADAIPGKEDPIPGESYYYYLQALNPIGGTTLSVSGPITIPNGD